VNAVQIAVLTRWDDYDTGHLTVPVPLFGKPLPFVLFPADAGAAGVTDQMAATIADVLALTPAQLPLIEAMLWDEVKFTFAITDYGVEEQTGETTLQANLRDFKVTGAPDALARASVLKIHISEDFDSRFATILVDTITDNLINIIVKNGRIIDWGYDGVHLGWFEKDEQKCAKDRARTRGEAGTA
jgi:hypothetical protein